MSRGEVAGEVAGGAQERPPARGNFSKTGPEFNLPQLEPALPAR